MVNLWLPQLQESWFFVLLVLKPWLISVRKHRKSEKILYALLGVKISPTLKHVINVNSPKKVSQDYEVMHGLHFQLLMSFQGHSFLSVMIICIQLQIWGASGSGCWNGAASALVIYFYFFWAIGMVPPGSWCPTQTTYSAYREQRYWMHALQEVLIYRPSVSLILI